MDDLILGIKEKKAKIGVVGLGQVGLPTALSLVERGYLVERPEAMKSGIVELLQFNSKSKSIRLKREWQVNVSRYKKIHRSPYGSGHAAEKIMKILQQRLSSLIKIHEHD